MGAIGALWDCWCIVGVMGGMISMLLCNSVFKADSSQELFGRGRKDSGR